MTTPPPEDLRQLLENAAKACGRRVLSLENGVCMLMTDHPFLAQPWQPHLPGLDSQVLAAELGISTNFGLSFVLVSKNGYKAAIVKLYDHPSKAHAQAMAVLRVAAAIGLAHKEKK